MCKQQVKYVLPCVNEPDDELQRSGPEHTIRRRMTMWGVVAAVGKRRLGLGAYTIGRACITCNGTNISAYIQKRQTKQGQNLKPNSTSHYDQQHISYSSGEIKRILHRNVATDASMATRKERSRQMGFLPAWFFDVLQVKSLEPAPHQLNNRQTRVRGNSVLVHWS